MAPGRARPYLWEQQSERWPSDHWPLAAPEAGSVISPSFQMREWSGYKTFQWPS